MPTFTTRPEIRGTFGVCTSTHYLATAVGMGILERGGNAFDAAVAMGFSLQICEPHMNGPGGEVPILFCPAGETEVQVLCGQGVAPAAANAQAYRDLGLDIVPGTGMLPNVVPGSFGAWMMLLRDHGTCSVRDVLEPAIGFARDGYAVVSSAADAMAASAPFFQEHWPGSAATYAPGGKPPEAGSLHRNAKAAETYERIIREAEQAGGERDAQINGALDAWYRGFVAEEIDTYCRTTEVMDTTGTPHKGLMTGDDLAAWTPSYETPVTFDYQADDDVYTMCKPGPWCQGPVMLQQLALLQGTGIGDMDPMGADFVHTIVEAAKLAFADRETFYGDPNFSDVPMDVLLSGAYNDERRALVGDTANLELRPGSVPGFGADIVQREKGAAAAMVDAAAHGVGEPSGFQFDTLFVNTTGAARGDTCHLDVIDKWGNMISATPSGGWLSSSPVIPALGFCLTTRGQMFSLEDDRPDVIAPGKRPRTTLSPSFALRDGEPYLAFGTPGGDQQDQWPLHMFLRHVHFGMNLQQAIDHPSFHTAHFPSSFYPREVDTGRVKMEGRFPKQTFAELQRRGHLVDNEGDWALGRISAAARDGGMLKAAANPRFMQGYAAGR